MSKNVTIGFQLANHPNKRGLYPIMIRITQERVSKRIRSPLEVKKEDWNQKSQQFRKSARDAKVASRSDTVIIKNLLAHSKLDETDRYFSNYGSTVIDAEMLKIFGRKQQENISSDKMELIRKLTEQLKTLILQG